MENNQNSFPGTPIRESEEAVLTCMLLWPNTLPEAVSLLTAEMFESPVMAFIYQAILAQYNRGEKPDMLTTETEMRRMDAAWFEQINGLAVIQRSMRRLRHHQNFALYAAEVKRRYLLRWLGALSITMQAKAIQEETVPDELITETETELLEIRHHLSEAKSLRLIGDVATETLGYHLDKMENKEQSHYVLTGFREFDEITGGMHNGELYVVAARPSDGKSAVAIQMSVNAALAGKQVAFFSTEMSHYNVMDRLFTGYAGVNPHHLRVSGLEASEIERMRGLTDNWQALPFYFDYMSTQNVENIRAQVLLQKRKTGCDMVVLDYLHMLEFKVGRGEILEQVIARQIRVLKRLALEADCPVLVVSQMNRASENRADKSHMPILSDLRDSGTIEQVADCVFFVYRPDRHGITHDPVTGESLDKIAKLLIIKNRNGPTGMARFVYNPSFTRLTNPVVQLTIDNWIRPIFDCQLERELGEKVSLRGGCYNGVSPLEGASHQSPRR